MNTIILFENSNTGKTTTIIAVYNMVLQNGGVVTSFTPYKNGDFTAEITYNNRDIYFHSSGDASSYVKNALQYATNNNFDTIICTARLTHITNPRSHVQVCIRRLGNTLNPLHLIQKTVATPAYHSIANTTDANIIFPLI